jgi:hypothetical protein
MRVAARFVSGALLLALARTGARAESAPTPPLDAPPSAPSAAPAGAASDPCAGPATARAPDPRCGETLDGRPPATPSTGQVAAQAALAVPRVATRAVLWPLVATTDVIEHHHLVDWMQALLTTDDDLVGVRPILHYSTSFVSSGGLRLFYGRLPGPGTQVSARFETAGPSVMLAGLELRGPKWSGLLFSATWNLRHDRLFAGTGPSSLSDLAASGAGLARYRSSNWEAEIRWSRPLPHLLVVGAHADLQRRDYSADDVAGGPAVTTYYGLDPAGCAALGLGAGCVDPAAMPGFDRGLRIAHAGGALGLNLREPGRERLGFSVIFDGTFAQGVGGDPSRHLTLSGESVLAVGGVNRALILRGRAATVERLGDAPIPFEELVSPSGQAGMRGFPDGRFRDASGLVGTAEYRWYISSYLDATLFSDLGTVAGPHFSGIVWDRWFPSFGLGFRFFQPAGAYWEASSSWGAQIAYAPDGGVRLLLSIAGF